MSTAYVCNNDSASKSNDDDVCEVNDMLQNMSTADNNMSLCANCGKEGASNTCNKCKQVRYCNAVCKKKHKHKHKKECERRVAELHDKELFKQPPRDKDDCPICFRRLPHLNTGSAYMSCCGKLICSGCGHAPVYDYQGNEMIEKICSFCRSPVPTSEEGTVERYKKRVEAGDPVAMCNQGNWYFYGELGFPQDNAKAFELWHKAGKLGYASAFCCIGIAYSREWKDKKKATHYWELAAMGGNAMARHCLGNSELLAGTVNRALKNYMIAVRDGCPNSLEMIKQMYSRGHATKDDYMKALQSYQTYLGEIKSDQRDKAAAACEEDYRYY